MQIERRQVSPDNRHYCEAWSIRDGDKEYWVTLRRTSSGPAWVVSIYVEPRSDQKPYWRALKNWQRLVGEVRAYENTRADFRDAS